MPNIWQKCLRIGLFSILTVLLTHRQCECDLVLRGGRMLRSMLLEIEVIVLVQTCTSTMNTATILYRRKYLA